MKKQITLFSSAIFISASFLSPTSSLAQKIGAGRSHSIALCSDSTVNVWGDNFFGQLADTSFADSYLPMKVSGLTGVIALAAGENHCLVLKKDSTVYAWGVNLYGTLGDGTNTSIGCYCKTTPVKVSGLTKVSKLAGGISHSLALKNDSTVWAWGVNGWGELGDASTTDRYAPVKVGGLSNIIGIAGGGHHSLALKNDGTVWSWGYNSAGQLGDSTLANKSTPLKVKGLTGVTALAAGWEFSAALKSDGTVWTWGYNAYGQLGDSTITDSWVPIQVAALTGVTAIATGSHHCFAIKSDSTVWAWGYNTSGQLGNGSTTSIEYPVKVSGLTSVTAIAGNFSGYIHSLALKKDGTMWAWGDNGWGQLGDGTISPRKTPVMVSPLLCSSTTDVQNSETTINSINIYPNPAHEQLLIELPDYKNAIAEIVTLEGQLIQRISLQATITEIKTNHLPSGFFLVKIKSPQGVFVKKFIRN